MEDPTLKNEIFVEVRLLGVFREEGGAWVAGYPRLDVYSQGDTPEEARENAADALRLWVTSCLDRGTLGDALRDLGWHRSEGSASSGEGEEQGPEERITVHRFESFLGESWEDRIKIPAYQAAEFMSANRTRLSE